MKKNPLWVGRLLAVVLFAAAAATATVPPLINYQGRLTDATGLPVDTTVSMRFTICSDSLCVLPVWTETQLSVTVVGGLFSAMLGAVVPIPPAVFDGSIRWLKIRIGTGVEMDKALPFVTSAYSFRSLWADSASYALSTPGGGESHWVVTDSMLQTSKMWGLARGGSGNIAYGDSSHTMVNLGTFSTTGTNGADYRYCTVGGGRSNVASHNWATVAGGRSNTATGEGATVGGGQFNDATDIQATIGGGIANIATGGATTIAGGYMNAASGSYSAIGGGNSNLTTGWFSAIGGGSDNEASGYYSSVAGGHINEADSMGSAVGGGFYNTALGQYSAVTGGYGNTAGRSYSMVAGGDSNSANGLYAFVGGGHGDSATAGWTTVGGGFQNQATDSYSAITGGFQNVASGVSSFVGGGHQDSATAQRATVGGGGLNVASGIYSTVAGGYNNRSSGSYGAIAGGRDNLISVSSACIPGGVNNTVDGYGSMAAGAFVNIESAANYTFAFGRDFTTSASNAVIFHNTNQLLRLGVGTPDPKVQLEVNDMVRIGGDTYPTAGRGMELAFNPDNKTALIQSYDRDSSLWGLLALNASKVGISTNTPSEKLDVNGKLRIRTVEAGTGTDIVVDATGVIKKVSSSKRYKQHIEPLSSDPERALQLQPVRFAWKSTGERDIGLIAEEVAEVVPELVIYDLNQKPDAVKYDRITLYLLQLVKAQQSRLDSQQERIDALEARLKELDLRQ